MNKIDVSKGIDFKKTSDSKDCDICFYWHFLNYIFKFQPNVCHRCHDLLMMSSDVLNIKGSVYHCIISKYETMNLVKSADLTKTSKTL